MHIKLYNYSIKWGGNIMLGLSTHEVEMKNVFISFMNNLFEYENLLRKHIYQQEVEAIELEGDNLILSIKAYFDISKEKLFEYLRTQYSDFDMKFEMAIGKPEYSDLLEMNHAYGMQAGTLFFFICIAVTKKEPKPEICVILNEKVRESMLKVHKKLQSELMI